MIAWIKRAIERHKASEARFKERYDRLSAEAKEADSKKATANMFVVFQDRPAHLIKMSADGSDFSINHAADVLRKNFIKRSREISQVGVTIDNVHYPPHLILRIALENVKVVPK